MKEYKFFDVYQILFLILTGVCFLVTNLVNVFASIYVLNNSDPETLEFAGELPYIYSLVYTMALFLMILFLVWFVIRAITFKSRKKEYELSKN